MGLPVQTLERREVRGKTGGGELKDVLDFAQVAQSMLAKIDELEGHLGGERSRSCRVASVSRI